MRNHEARLGRLVQRLERQRLQMQEQAFALYDRTPRALQDKLQVMWTAAESGDYATMETAGADVCNGSPEWRQLLAAYEAIVVALEGCKVIRYGTRT